MNVREIAVDVLVTFDWFVLVYFVVLNSSYLALIVIAAMATRRRHAEPETNAHDDLFANPLTPPISIVIGAYNEQAGIVESVRAALGLRYPHFEIVVVDDGSTDATFERLRDAFGLIEVATTVHPSVPVIGAIHSTHLAGNGEPLVVVRKANAGRRADALNAGLNAARHPLVCCVDADSLLEPDALLRVAQPFVDDPDRFAATGGAIRAANGSTVHRGQLTSIRQPRRWLERIQIIEYLRSFLLGRTGWSQIGALLIISGAFGLYRRDLVIEIGGFDPDSLGEDADLVVGLHRLLLDRGVDYRIVYVPEPVCWTEVPSTRAVLARQRRRWSHGLAQVLWKHRSMIGRKRYGRVGTIAMPYYLAFELLGPIVELAGLITLVVGLTLGIVSADFAILFVAVAIAYGIVVSIAALLVEEISFHRYERWRDLLVATIAAVVENIGFRQIHAAWRLHGLANAVRRHESAWGDMPRTGFADPTSASIR